MSTPTSSQFSQQQQQYHQHHAQYSQSNRNQIRTVAGYVLTQKLGSGSFATVYKGVKARDANTQQQEQQQQEESATTTDADVVAIKAITRNSDKLTKKVLENLDMEIKILQTYRHPNIVCLQNVQKSATHYYLILEYCGGGDVQGLIRTRKNGKLTERLTRRLIRDLAQGLQFLWGQELIHRDIKPQNLLLTGPLPLDEMNDPAKIDEQENTRRKANFPSAQFQLKIADFGFARQLQTASLAETLCGSPLYMAPEILQHQRYDTKADLWSVGTVLFEMIAGRPPFHGENHIDLLRNIQKKAVRLPPDVRVSKECVNLLRILLNRNPLSRAGFKEFFEAADAFVSLGCNGVANTTSPLVAPLSQQHPTSTNMDLGTIQEVDPAVTHGAHSMLTVETHAFPQTQQQGHQVITTAPRSTLPNQQPGYVTPPLGPTAAPPTTLIDPPIQQQQQQQQQQQAVVQYKSYQQGFAPLEPSPPAKSETVNNHYMARQFPSLPFPGIQESNNNNLPAYKRSDSQNSSDESEFVMVEHSKTGESSLLTPTSSVVQRSNPTSPSRYYINTTNPAASAVSTGTRGEYLFINNNRCPPKGMLSTSPGTGQALFGLMAGGGGATPLRALSNSPNKIETQVDSAEKMLSTAEDVGRRAVSVAHLGDTRAYLAMRLLVTSEESTGVLATSSPMEGVVEEVGRDGDDHSSAEVTDCESSTNTEVAATGRRRASACSDRSMHDAKQTRAAVEESEDEEMPFAVAPPRSTAPKSSVIPVRTSSGSGVLRKAKNPNTKPTVHTIRSHFNEALACYLKALSMLKGSVSAAQRVKRDLDELSGPAAALSSSEEKSRIKTMLHRCDVTSTWLSGQFTGVLERADAANIEIRKLPTQTLSERNEALPVVTVEELIYNHSLTSGRDGAVKQLLGQYDAARSCYRSAGLLAETLLMEPKIGAEDRKLLEGYVDGFAARITELDETMLQQSRVGGGSSTGGHKKNKPPGSVVGLIGGIPPLVPPTTGNSNVVSAPQHNARHGSNQASASKAYLPLAS